MSTRADFWARRKAAVQLEEAAANAATEQQAAQAEREALEAKEDAEILAELNLPDPDALQMGDDVRGFMAQVVPDRLRRRALRQLWRLNPVLANIDELVDYGEDFTDAACVIENMQTTYQVGKGMLAHVQEMARQAEATETAPPEDDPQGTDEEPTAPPAEVASQPEQGAQSPPEGLQEMPVLPATLPDDQDSPPPAPAPRRMRFDFEG